MNKKITLLIVGDADTIFLTNYVRSLKKKMEVNVTVYSPFPNKDENSPFPYDNVHFHEHRVPSYKLLRVMYFILLPLIQYINFRKYIKDKKFDIIHIHRIIPAWVIYPTLFKQHCKKLYLSFWGGEIDREKLFFSKKIYLCRLGKLINISYKIVGAMNDVRITNRFSEIKNKSAFGAFGSSIISILVDQPMEKSKSREKFNIPEGKISVLLGYSGKVIHNHCQIIEGIVQNSLFADFKSQIHFIASMTRGSNPTYTTRVEDMLESSGCTYTLLKDCYQTDHDVAELRNATDIFFQLSTSDYLSASVKENLCSGAIMISGNWLPYGILKSDGFYFEEADSIRNGITHFYEIMSNYTVFKEKAERNASLCGKQYTWDGCIDNWVNAYKC